MDSRFIRVINDKVYEEDIRTLSEWNLKPGDIVEFVVWSDGDNLFTGTRCIIERVNKNDLIAKCIDDGTFWSVLEEPSVKAYFRLISRVKDSSNEKIGYHINDIQKGELGEISKIVEETQELLDAHRQGVKIMQQIELSDLYGAMIMYMEKYHPELSMEDLKEMYKVTRRAFENGHR